MTGRSKVVPDLESVSAMDHLAAHLEAWHSDVQSTIETLVAVQAQVDTRSTKLESPRAALEYLDGFQRFFERACADLRGVQNGLGEGRREDQIATLHRLTEAAAVEERRVVAFRDKWINKPLPYEEVRPLLTQMATCVTDQLTDLHELPLAAAKLAELEFPVQGAAQAPPDDDHSRPALDRRALFTRIWRGGRDDESST